MSKTDIKISMTPKEYIRRKALKFLGLIDSNINPVTKSERLTFVNDINDIKQERLREYNVWYGGDSDELINYYTRAETIDYNKDPLYNRNKKCYFWSVAATENDIKRTHSGQPRNVVDTLVNIVGLPKISFSDEFLNKRINQILDDNDFGKMFIQTQMPLTLVEGWGCYKINYDTYLRDTPILLYYRADSVDFIYKSNQLIAIIFKDYYQDENGTDYVLFETRRITRENGETKPKLVIEKDLYRMSKGNIITPCELDSLPELRDVVPVLELNNYNGFLAVPCIIYKDSNEECYGRSIFTGKLDLFDDLDQALSQAATTVRRSTVHEYYNSNYLERDEASGLPIQPKAFDRKFILFNGGADANGSTAGQTPVLITQPAVNIEQYNAAAINILLEAISGLMSPATLGIDIAKKDNAEAQREKEKVTIFTRNTIIYEMQKTVKKLCNELMCAWELMNKGEITCKNYEDLDVKFDEFADDSFENKLNTLLAAYQVGVITPRLFIDSLYGDQLSEEKKAEEVAHIEMQLQAEQQMAQLQAQGGGEPGGEGMSQEEMALLGALMGGNNNNEHNEETMKPENRVEEFAR